ncbi:MAG: diphosphate--fructose-6-phosphate 1-phosphotransferase [Myxococcota bacterium]
MATFGILVGGGPAPGINGVIGAAVTSAAQSGAQVVGILEGFRWLIEGDTNHVVDLTKTDTSRIHLQGGSILQTSRANPTRDPRHLEAVVKSLEQLGVDHLITIGGDDTAYSARRVAESAGDGIRVVHVPKTIDNDLPLPHGIPTFGFETARARAADTLRWLAEDARTSPRWYFVVVMGRQAGHLALGAGKAAGADVSLIPEEFDEIPLRLETVTRLLEGAMLKGRAEGRPHGVAVIAEGIGERLDPADLAMLDDVERDEHGHIRLAEVPLAVLLRDRVRSNLAERGVKFPIVEKDVGYELRCAEPCAFDQDYTRDLGAGAVATLLAGHSQVLITRQEAAIVPIPFLELMDPDTGKTRVRDVDVGSDSYATARACQHRLGASDLEDPARLAAIAAAGNLSVEEARERFARVVG